ncbi:hypothetical protein B0J11DRAFT_583140 [Dendryphion nanum]|uniref:Uncharacterized protein n=1 Tax=Dendryphion nanum TaxID=256645 RepID=A0A9P9DF14_9PLEO|nr:hypothetical protein B0J11DRAFT_583140 [Dendryphion nanum]
MASTQPQSSADPLQLCNSFKNVGMRYFCSAKTNYAPSFRGTEAVLVKTASYTLGLIFVTIQAMWMFLLNHFSIFALIALILFILGLAVYNHDLQNKLFETQDPTTTFPELLRSTPLFGRFKPLKPGPNFGHHLPKQWDGRTPGKGLVETYKNSLRYKSVRTGAPGAPGNRTPVPGYEAPAAVVTGISFPNLERDAPKTYRTLLESGNIYPDGTPTKKFGQTRRDVLARRGKGFARDEGCEDPR